MHGRSHESLNNMSSAIYRRMSIYCINCGRTEVDPHKSISCRRPEVGLHKFIDCGCTAIDPPKSIASATQLKDLGKGYELTSLHASSNKAIGPDLHKSNVSSHRAKTPAQSL